MFRTTRSNMLYFFIVVGDGLYVVVSLFVLVCFRWYLAYGIGRGVWPVVVLCASWEVRVERTRRG